MGRIPRTDGASAGQIVNRLLDPKSPERIDEQESFGQRARSEGVRQLLAGAFGVFRNPAAHQPVE